MRARRRRLTGFRCLPDLFAADLMTLAGGGLWDGGGRGRCRPGTGCLGTDGIVRVFAGLENGTSSEADLEKAKSMLPPPLASFLDRKSDVRSCFCVVFRLCCTLNLG